MSYLSRKDILDAFGVDPKKPNPFTSDAGTRAEYAAKMLELDESIVCKECGDTGRCWTKVTKKSPTTPTPCPQCAPKKAERA